MLRRRLVPVVALLGVITVLPEWSAAQPVQQDTAVPSADAIRAAIAQAAPSVRVDAPPAKLVYANRVIVEMRATVTSRPPAVRVASIIEVLDRLRNELPSGRVNTQTYGDAILVSIGSHPVFVLFPADADALAGERLYEKAADAAARLQLAFDEAQELKSPRRLAVGGALALGATIIYGLVLWFVIRIERRLAARASRMAERKLAHLPGGQTIAELTNTGKNVQRAFMLLAFLLGTILTYSWAAMVLRRFPYTRPWGESLRGGLFSAVGSAGRTFVDALPNLLVVLVIVVVTRFLARLASLAFVAVEQGRLSLPWVHADTAQPTRRIVIALLWLCALVMSYGYLPGASSDAFKGVSVFVGLIISLGSTGIMNQVMSGLMVTYSRALKHGDFVRVADTEGTVVSIGVLSTKVRTARNEEVTIPNAVVVSNATTNFTRLKAEGVYAKTSVTIGYDAPWRQVHALLLLAAKKTPGVQAEPAPVVLQTSLQDHAVEYTLLVVLEQPHRRYVILDGLHARIQDAFNQYGVQIMSPRYEADPSGLKVVPPARWYSAPAVPPSEPAHVPAERDVEQIHGT